MNRSFMLVTLLWLVLGCTAQPDSNGALPEAVATDTQPPVVPASFTGDLPCADCRALRYQLSLFADGAFFLRQTYLGKPPPNEFDDIGSWAWPGDGQVLLLRGGREGPVMFGRGAGDTLQLLDLNGRAIDSELNYALRRDAVFSRLEPRLNMRGMFTYMADAPAFTECLTGQRWPVAQRGNYLELERAYLDTIETPGQPLLATVEGEVRLERGMEGDQLLPTLSVLRFGGVWPGTSCGRRAAAEAP